MRPSSPIKADFLYRPLAPFFDLRFRTSPSMCRLGKRARKIICPPKEYASLFGRSLSAGCLQSSKNASRRRDSLLHPRRHLPAALATGRTCPLKFVSGCSPLLVRAIPFFPGSLKISLDSRLPLSLCREPRLLFTALFFPPDRLS